MAKKKNKTEDQFEQVEQALSKTEQFIEDNQQILVKIVGGIVLAISLVIGVKNFYLEPRSAEANSEMFMAELYFQKDSFDLALNGDGQYLGFIDIADDYGITKAGKLAKYYAGICYLNLSDYENAIDYLKSFSSSDILLSSLALGCIGDAYMELEDQDKALKYYEEATEESDHGLTTPKYLFRQAMIHENNKDYDDALEIYKRIKSDYENSKEANGIEKYISRAENR